MSIAFVDVDKTLTRSNMSFSFGSHLYFTERLSLFKALACSVLYGCHALGLLRLDSLHRFIFSIVFRGKNRDEILSWAREFFTQCKSSLFRPSMIAELAFLKEKRVPTILISSSPDFLVSLVSEAFGGLEYQATEYRWNSLGFFSSIGTVMSGAQKGKIAAQYRKKGYNTIFAFTDSLQDQPLLEASDEVVVVSPEMRLKSLAKERGWRIIQR